MTPYMCKIDGSEYKCIKKRAPSVSRTYALRPSRQLKLIRTAIATDKPLYIHVYTHSYAQAQRITPWYYNKTKATKIVL